MFRSPTFACRAAGFIIGLVPFALLGVLRGVVAFFGPAAFSRRNKAPAMRIAVLARRHAEVFFPGIVTLTPYDDFYYRVVKIDGPQRVKASEIFIVTVALENLGKHAWDGPDGASPVRLGTWNPENRRSLFEHTSWPRPDRPGSLEGQVQPRETGCFKMTLCAPSRGGSYREELAPVADGLRWFPGETIAITIVVVG